MLLTSSKILPATHMVGVHPSHTSSRMPPTHHGIRLAVGEYAQENNAVLPLTMRGMPLYIEQWKGECMAPETYGVVRKMPLRCCTRIITQYATLFRRIGPLQDQATQWEIALHIFDELEVHAQLEEVVFYQAVEEKPRASGDAWCTPAWRSIRRPSP